MKRTRFLSCVLVILAAATLASCSEETVVNNGNNNTAQNITKDTLTGSIKGVMTTGKTYYIVGYVRVNRGDTLIVEPGVNVVALPVPDSAKANTTTLYINGTILANGTADKPINFGPVASRQFPGAWVGLRCDSPNVVSLKHIRLEYGGGPRPDGRPGPAIYFWSDPVTPSKFYLEDSYVGKTPDDAFMLNGGVGHVLRNYFALSGINEGSGINFRLGFKGNVAYNYVWSSCDHAVRVETSTTLLYPQTDVNIYNNTIVNFGFKNISRPGAGISMDRFARGNIYNNIIVNGVWGIRISSTADAANIHYGNNLFYSTDTSLHFTYYPTPQSPFHPDSARGSAQPSDLIGVDPMFVNLDLNVRNTVDLNDVHLKPGSPALGKGNATYDPDLGAYTAKR